LSKVSIGRARRAVSGRAEEESGMARIYARPPVGSNG
jgi:hypothetical protein